MVNEAVKEAMEKMTEQVRQGRCQEQVMEAAYDNQRGGLGEEFELVQDNPPEQQRSALVPTGNVSASVRQKIISHKYVDLKSLLLPSERPPGGEDKQYLVAEGGKITLGSGPQKDDLSVNGWTKAFLRFANIYIQEYPSEAGDILKYMSTVMDLTSKGLGKAWKEYDESFRKAREVSPEAYPWDHPPQMIWMGAVAAGLSTFQGERRIGGADAAQTGPRQAVPRGIVPEGCRDYNSRAGCAWPNCRFRHSCNRCGGGHGAYACFGMQRGGGATALRPIQQAGQSGRRWQSR